MDGENNGKPYEQMDDLGGKPLFLETPKCFVTKMALYFPSSNRSHGPPPPGTCTAPRWQPTIWKVCNRLRFSLNDSDPPRWHAKIHGKYRESLFQRFLILEW